MAFFVRALTSAEQQELEELCDKYQADEEVLKHLQLILLSSERHKSSEIAHQLELGSDTVRKWIKRFNREGIACLEAILPIQDKDNGRTSLASRIAAYPRPIFARVLTAEENDRLEELMGRYSQRPVAVKRFQIIILSSQGISVTEIASQLELPPQIVRFWIKQFNRQGVIALETLSDKSWRDQQLLVESG